MSDMVAMKPANYPLPWCEKADAPYWQINFSLCLFKAGWREWQKGKPMAEIIPMIDEELK